MVQVVQQLVKEILDPLSALTWGFRESNTFFSHLLLTTCTWAAKVWKKITGRTCKMVLTSALLFFYFRDLANYMLDWGQIYYKVSSVKSLKWNFVYYICKHRYNHPRNISMTCVCVCVCLHACERVRTTNRLLKNAIRCSTKLLLHIALGCDWLKATEMFWKYQTMFFFRPRQTRCRVGR